MVATKTQDPDQQASRDERIAASDAEQITSNYRTYLFPDANNGQGAVVKARTQSEAIAKLEKNEGSK